MSKKILIIDDDLIYRLIISKLVGKIDSSVSILQSENGAIGLEKLNAIQTSATALIIFLDLNMPVLDGWGVLQEITLKKINEKINFDLYIVSSSTDDQDLLKAEQYSFVKGFLNKPLDSNLIQKILQEI